jgi:hypothetical protein
MNRSVSWFWNLSKARKTAVLLVYFMVLGASGIAIAYPNSTQPHASASTDHEHAAHETLATAQEKQIQMNFKEEIPFKKTTVQDPTLPQGQSYVRTAGINGKRNVTYEITYTDGKETDRRVLSEEVLQKPVDEVKVVGTKEALQPEAQVQGAQTEKKKTTSPASAAQDPEPTPEPQPTPARKVWAKVNDRWKRVCVESSDSRFYNNILIKKYSSLAACEATLRDG